VIRKTTYIGLAIIGGLAIGTVFAPPPGVPGGGLPNLSTAFRGYTNDATGTPIARFTVSNLTGSAMYCYRPFIEVKTTNGLEYLRESNISWAVTLDRNASCDFTIPFPTDHSRWKLTFLVYSPTGMKRTFNNFANEIFRRLWFKPPYRTNPYKIETDWIEAAR
jgi:hypothetical protein